MGRDTSFFTTIKERVPLEDYLTKHLNVDLVHDGPGRMAALCPFHGEDTPSFKVMESADGSWLRWHCFGSCADGGTVIDAAMRAEGFTIANEAAQYLNELYGLGLEVNDEAYKAFRRTVAETTKTIEEGEAEMAKGESSVSQIARDYLHNRGFTDETIAQFRLNIDTSHAKSGRLAIPLIDKANHPVSVANRALFDFTRCASCREKVTPKEMVKRRFQAQRAKEKGEAPLDWESCPHCGESKKESRVSWLITQDPKYRYIRDFDKARFLYNEHEARRALNKDETIQGLFLVEGYADVWSAVQSGHPATCAYNGSQLSEWQAREAVELVTRADKPIILVPDFDPAGFENVDKNIMLLRQVRQDIEIQIIHGVDALPYQEDGATKACKDLGDVLKHYSADKVSEVLISNRWPAAEYQIRQIIKAKNSKTGQDFHSQERQMQLVAGILSEVYTKSAIDHLVPYLAHVWDKREELIRNWFYSNLSQDNVTSFQHLIKDITQAREEAHNFLLEGGAIPTGFDELDRCMPGNGVRTGQLMMFLGKSGTGKTMLATQMLANMADNHTRAIFFSLEQAAKSLYARLVSQALDVRQETAEELIKTNSSELDKVDHLFRNVLILDNVPSGEQKSVSMTADRIRAIVQEANMTHFSGKPVEIVIIDHLGILEVGEDAPRDVRSNDLAAPGFVMQELFHVCKEVDVAMMVLQQLPKEVSPGKPFSYDSGRGGSKQTDYCDYIFCIWRPEQDNDLSDTERIEVGGQYKLALGKNRYGPSTVAHLMFDKASLRIMPPLQITQPIVEVEAVEDEAEAAAMTITRAPASSGEDPLVIAAPEIRTPTSTGDGATQAGIEAIVRQHPDATPRDTKDLLASLGAVEEDDDPDQMGNPELLDWFES
jgi:DNA primase